jgi:putative FmdB family regulatory protein
VPIYEYRCQACSRRAQIFFRSFSAAESPKCPHCQSDQLTRLVSRVGIVHSAGSYQDFVSDPTNFDGIDYNDPKAVAQWARRMGDAAGVDLGPEYEEMVSQIGEGSDMDAGGGPGDDDFGF